MSEHVIREGVLFGMGNPLLDISANTDEGFLQKYGLKPDNAILAEEKHRPMYDEMISKYEVEYIAGGSVQNTMRVFQWLVEFPNAGVFMGCIGKDKFGRVLEEKAREAGVNVQYQYHPTEPTGTCAVIVTGNGTNRSLCANLAAANCFTKDHLDLPENQKLLHNAEFYYISGFFLTVSPDSILEVGEYACKQNRCFLMNLSAPFISQFFKDPLLKALPFVDILFGNETEGATFAKEMNFGVTCLKEIALKICDLPKANKSRPRVVILTQGNEPVLYATGSTVREFPVTQLESSKIIDTNGAGDSFVGGFLAQLIQGNAIESCINCGIYAATEIIQRSGCTLPPKHTFSG